MAEKRKAGHRQRLRDRFVGGEESSRSEEALLELLLTYAIPQKDVQPLAKRLLAEFGSLAAVLNASAETLCKFDGVKENSAVLLKLVDWIRLHCGDKSAVNRLEASSAQATLFDVLPDKEEKKPPAKRKRPPKKIPARRGTEMFTNAVLKEAVALLPGAPDTESIDEIRAYLRDSLHYSAEQTRQRYASYITRRMFPNGRADAPMLAFARTFPKSQALRDVCFYRFLKAEPLEVQVVEDVLLPNLGMGCAGRDRIRTYIAKKFPASKSIKGCGQAVVDALDAGGVAKVDRTKITFSMREIPVPAFAFVLHSEFPEPGMYDIGKLEENRIVRAMLWKPERLLPSLYELRNMGIISKVSEIDSVRQFTTKYTLEEAVKHLVAASLRRDCGGQGGNSA